MTLYRRFLTRNDCYAAGRTITPQGVMVHSTGANNPKVSRYVPGDEVLGVNRNGNHWDRPGVDKCVHAFIGKIADGSVAAVQTLPWDRRGWHAGTGTSGRSANDTHIAFEICEDGLDDLDYFAAVYQAAAELTALLCRQYGLDPLADGVVLCHQEGYRRGVASNHADVLHWFPRFGKSMDDFRVAVAALVREEDDPMSYEQWVQYMDRYRAELAAQAASPWAEPFIRAAVDAGLMADAGGSIQRPRDFVTREELATGLAAVRRET